MPPPLRATRMPVLVVFDDRAGFRQRVERRPEVRKTGALKHYVAAGRRHRHRKRSGLDAIGENGMDSSFKPVAALNAQRRRADAFDLGAHFDEAIGDVADFRLARRVLDHRLALGERRRQQDVVGRADRDFREIRCGRRASPSARLAST